MSTKMPKVQVYEENIEGISLQESFNEIQYKLEELADINGLLVCESERDNRLARLHELKTYLIETYRSKQLEDIEETFKWIVQGCGVSSEFLTAINLINNMNNIGNQIHEAFRKELERYHK